MKRELNKIFDDYLSKSDYRELITETETLIKDSPEVILELMELLKNSKVEEIWKRKQIRERFLSFLLILEDSTQIKITYQVLRKYSENINIKKLADKLCFFVNRNKLLNQILETISEKQLTEFNSLLVQELVLRGKIFKEEEKEIIVPFITTYDFNWVGLDLTAIEKGLSLRSYTLNGGGLGISFGLQCEAKFPYQLSEFESIQLYPNDNKELNDLSHVIAKEYIRLVEIGYYEYIKEEVHDLEAGIICQLDNYEHSTKSTNIAFKAIKPKEVFKYLFNMSLLGGAYESGEYSATSRINSWKVISGLIQKNYSQSKKDEIVVELNNFQWTEFSCENDWFINEWIDLGIIGINEAERKYAVLIISDTD